MNDPVAARPRRLVVGLGLLALTIAWITMAGLGWATPWYRHVEISPPTLSNALALNTALLPAGHHEPGLLTSYSLALDWRLRHHAGSPVAWNLAAIGQSGEPLAELRSLVHAGRAHSRLLVILLIICGGALACAVIPGLESGSFSVALLCSSAGLLYHGLVVRPELLGCGLGVGMLLSVWLGTAASTWWQHQRGLFIAGLCGGLAAVAQPSGLFYLLVGYSWCWLAGLTAPGPRPGRPGLYSGLLPLACAVVLLALAHQATVAGTLTAVTGERLRGFALLAGLLPLLALWPDSGRAGAFLRERAGEFALLGSGALGALILAFVALRAILPAEAALTAWTGQLELFFYPGPFLEKLLTVPPGTGGELVRLVRESPFLFVAAPALALAAGVQRGVPARTKAFIGLLLAAALGHLWLLAHERYLESASVGVQVPLLLAGAIALLAVGPWPHRAGERPWLAPVILVAAVVLVVTMPLRLRVKSPAATAAEKSAVSAQTLQDLFYHPAHPPAYRRMMQDHYHDRAGFERALDRYLAVPAHRY